MLNFTWPRNVFLIFECEYMEIYHEDRRIREWLFVKIWSKFRLDLTGVFKLQRNFYICCKEMNCVYREEI
jgi:hypothetical protein